MNEACSRSGPFRYIPWSLKNKSGPAQVGALSKAQKWLEDFKVSKYSLLQHPKTFFWKKSHNPEKKPKRGPFRIFQHPFCRKTPKNWRGTVCGIFSLKKSRNAEKIKGRPFGLVRYCMLRGKPFCLSSLGTTGTIWRLPKIL